MVHCQKCGTENEDGSAFCKKCGASLSAQSLPQPPQPTRRPEQECFGIPYGGAIVGLIFGGLLVIYGLAMLMGVDLGRYSGAIAMIVIGALIVLGAYFAYTRARGP